MFDAKKLLDQLLGSQVPGAGGTVRDRAGQLTQLAKDNPLKTAGLAAVLLGTGTGRDIAGGALKLGGLAAIAGLGYQAYKNYQAGQTPVAADAPAQSTPVLLPPPADSGFSAEPEVMRNDFVLVLVRAMIAAARADGHIDDTERARIMDKVKLSGLDSEAESFLRDELSKPVDLDAMVSAAKTEEERVELYTASRLAIDADNRAERGYLDQLAGRLGLADALIDHIEATVSAAKTGAIEVQPAQTQTSVPQVGETPIKSPW
ncbi:tellurite resistance TerB family protein [Rhizobium sp. 32-5/1]|uniref:tellurite resistance TerB family protein n=1 Tax=Rhizobium sp. 32-5/1 TaxID=3019602 RepID=UPI00240D1433|nr:tellurite resistance TerB family protein [Rhizobium sp. 32-5/1]WEZ82498.1 tellurite resistance TerB family protein [Rhizobium sp. 32-5/1]